MSILEISSPHTPRAQASFHSLPTVPFEFAREHLLLPLADEGASDGVASIRCLTAGIASQSAIDNLSNFLGAPLFLEVVSETEVREAITRTYQEQMTKSNLLQQQSASSESSPPGVPSVSVQDELAKLNDRELLASADKAPIARLVDALLFDALTKGASDLHVHPHPPHPADQNSTFTARPVVRYRIDGVLQNMYEPDPAAFDQIVGRIKVLAGMDVAEKRLPQDGRTSFTIGNRQIDLRVSTLPTTCGERVVIRLLEQTAKLKALSELGMPTEIESSLQEAIRRSHGLILVTGPTGSGKTTTIYSLLSQLDATEKNILTLEDPVEYKLPGISQTQISEKKGMSFLTGLRHVLRQDPDIILIGETRDEATARMIIQSSLTGHLVLTTLHTNSAAGAVARLADLNIEPYLITSSLIGVLAQRLVRRRCQTCLPPHNSDHSCSTCNGSGYSGRMGIYEWLPATPEIKQQILKNPGAEAIERIAVQEGMSTLHNEGMKYVAKGLTTEEEVLRVLGTSENV